MTEMNADSGLPDSKTGFYCGFPVKLVKKQLKNHISQQNSRKKSHTIKINKNRACKSF